MQLTQFKFFFAQICCYKSREVLKENESEIFPFLMKVSEFILRSCCSRRQCLAGTLELLAEYTTAAKLGTQNNMDKVGINCCKQTTHTKQYLKVRQLCCKKILL